MYIASISNDLKIHVWPNGQLVHTYKPNLEGYVKSISWSKDGSWLVLVPSRGSAEIISVRDNLKHLHSIQDIQQPTCAAFQTTTKRNIALGTTTGTALVYDIKSKTVRKHFPRAPSTIFKVEYCVKDSFLAAACENGEVLLYNSVTYNLSSSYKLPKSKTVSALCCHSTKRNLISAGSGEGIVGVWDIHTNRLIYNMQAHSAAVTDLTFPPLRHDLIVTVGYDRKLAFYNLAEKNCVVQKILERSATAIDFCPDSVGLAIALQDGTIVAYDTRQLNEPLYTYKGHNYQIKQLVFQKQVLESSPSEYTFSNDSIDSKEEANLLTEKSRHSFDSLGNMFCGDVLPDIPEIPTDVGSDMDGGDSFLDALGMNSLNATLNSPRESIPSLTEGPRKLRDSKLTILENTPNSPTLKLKSVGNSPKQDVQRRVSETYLANKGLAHLQVPQDGVKMLEVSTPKLPSESAPQMFVSPIVAQSNSNGELIKVIRDVVKQEMKDVVKHEMESLQQQLKYDFMDVVAQMRRHFLDLQMSIVKEFVQLESNISRIKIDYNGDDGFGEECLIQENLKLRRELAALREQTVSNSDD